LSKNFEDFKETDTDEEKLNVIKAKNFIKRISTHLRDIQPLANLFNVFGYAPIHDYLIKD